MQVGFNDVDVVRGAVLSGLVCGHVAVVDYSGEPFDVEADVGFGLTSASDHWVLKLMYARDLHWRRILTGLLSIETQGWGN